MYTSKFRIVSVGIVLEALIDKQGYAKICPIELTPEIDGILLPEEGEIIGEGVDGSGTPYSANVKVGNYVKAQWLSHNSNRLTPPDLQKGEQTLLWKFSNEDKYYWTSMGRDDNLRRLETVSYVYSNLSDPEMDEPLTIDNSYVISVSTKEKHITLSTAMNDGEPFRYLIQLNTRDGGLLIEDDAGNYIVLNSDDTLIELANEAGSKISLDEEDIFITSPNDFVCEVADNATINVKNKLVVTVGGETTIDSGGKVSISSGGDTLINSGANLFITSSGSSELTSGGSYSVDAGSSLTLDSSTTTTLSGGVRANVTAPAVSISGGSVSVSGGRLRGESESGSGSEFRGDVNFFDSVLFLGQATFDGTMTSNANCTFNNNVSFGSLVTCEANAVFNGITRFKSDVFGTRFFGTLYGNVVPRP